MLEREPNLSAPDDFYEALIDTHRDLDLAQSHALNARLLLLLANHIGDQAVLQEALAKARANVLARADANADLNPDATDTPEVP